jgi:hypothetical protein
MTLNRSLHGAYIEGFSIVGRAGTSKEEKNAHGVSKYSSTLPTNVLQPKNVYHVNFALCKLTMTVQSIYLFMSLTYFQILLNVMPD